MTFNRWQAKVSWMWSESPNVTEGMWRVGFPVVTEKKDGPVTSIVLLGIETHNSYNLDYPKGNWKNWCSLLKNEDERSLVQSKRYTIIGGSLKSCLRSNQASKVVLAGTVWIASYPNFTSGTTWSISVQHLGLIWSGGMCLFSHEIASLWWETSIAIHQWWSFGLMPLADVAVKSTSGPRK